MQKGVTVWFTGLSGSGKTTINRLVETQLRKTGIRVEVLDGDDIRKWLAADLGFSKEDRRKNIERAAFVAKLLTRNDVLVLASFISPFREMREYCRKEIGSFVEVFVNCPLEVCVQRDVKGLYKKAIAGQIEHFTGISDPYEAPESPEVTVYTDRETAEESTGKVIGYLQSMRYIPPA
ncbi:adenylyl-sulfate kinase [Brevibacillus borstelensis]|uniref:adenylyl-sulfate kinase n=1 Tax=Brevibacillus borstelensis TaxID=45462 RepID=UPI0030BA88E5